MCPRSQNRLPRPLETNLQEEDYCGRVRARDEDAVSAVIYAIADRSIHRSRGRSLILIPK